MVRNLVQVTHLGPSRLVRIIEFLRAYYFTRKSGHGLGRRFVKRVQRSVIRVSNENSSFFPLSFALLPSLSSFFFLSPLFTTVHILSPMQHARVSDYSKTAHVPGGSGSQPSPPTLYSRACTYMHRGRRGVSIRTSTPRSLVEPLSLHLADPRPVHSARNNAPDVALPSGRGKRRRRRRRLSLESFSSINAVEFDLGTSPFLEGIPSGPSVPLLPGPPPSESSVYEFLVVHRFRIDSIAVEAAEASGPA